MPYSDAEYYQKNKQKYLERSKKWREANPERFKENVRRWKAENPDRVKNHRRNIAWKMKGIDMTWKRYDQILQEQGGVCALCKQPPKKRKLAVDHCPETGRVRGLLCYGCNVALGYLNRLKNIGMDAVQTYLDAPKSLRDPS